MKGNSDGRREAREIFQKGMQNGITFIASIAMLVGVYVKGSYAADTFLMAVPDAECAAFTFLDAGPIRAARRYSPTAGADTPTSFSDQTATKTCDRRFGASLHVAEGQLPFWTLSARASEPDSCANRHGSFQSVNSKLVLRSGMEVADRIANASATSDLSGSGYMVVNAENLSAGRYESRSGVRYTDTPGHNESDMVSGSTALPSPGPEPRIFAMMLAGLGLMGFVASRRQT